MFDSYSDFTIKRKLVQERRSRVTATLEDLLVHFTPSERLALYVFSGLLALSVFFLLAFANAAVSVDVPARGGSLTEGEIGPARFINPVLTLSQADEDLTKLVYSGLMRAMPDGSYAPDLAERYEISEDGLTYTFHLRGDATFHDGKQVTSADVVFTVGLAQDPAIRSSRRADWEGVSASAPDSATVVFKLPRAYAPFIENASMGILPKHIWQNVSAEEFPFSPANTRPIGSGPYRVANVATDSTGSPTRYDLVSFAKYALGEAHIPRITFYFYPNQEAMIAALNQRKIDAIAAVSAKDVSTIKREDLAMVRATLPRTFGIFFNQSHAPVLADASVRQALDAAIDKQHLVNDILGGFGVVLQSPIPPGVSGDITPASPQPIVKRTLATTTSATFAEHAQAILQKGGWTFDTAQGHWTKKAGKETLTLSFTLATADSPDLVRTANAVKDMWATVGIQVTVQVYPLSEFNTGVLRPRSYDAVLFGEVVGRERDLFAFWHSSQRNDPGLNLAMYTNSKADALLSQARTTTDEKQRDKLYTEFTNEIQKDAPAVFLFAPQFVYVVPQKLSGVEIGALTSPSERFLAAYRWYAETERVWNVFAKQ